MISQRIIAGLVVLISLTQIQAAKPNPNFWHAASSMELPFEEQVISQTQHNGIVTRDFYFTSEVIDGQPCRIYAIYAAPQNAKKGPAVLFIHGGQGTADRSTAEFWAQNGYACLTYDWTGYPIDMKKPREQYSKFPGAKNLNYNNMIFTPQPKDSRILRAIIAARRGLTWLEQQPEVSSDQLCLEGLSWGGICSLVITAVDPRVKVLMNIYGSGFFQSSGINNGCFGVMGPLQFLPKDSQKAWLDAFDGEHHVDAIRAPMLMANGTNDMFNWLPLPNKTYNAVKSDKRYWLEPNVNHTLNMKVMNNAALQWFNLHLKGIGSAWPIVGNTTMNSRNVTFTMNTNNAKISNIQVHYLWLPKVPTGSGISIYQAKTSVWNTTTALAGGDGQWRALLPLPPENITAVAVYPMAITNEGLKSCGEMLVQELK